MVNEEFGTNMYYQSFQKHKRINVFFFNGEVHEIDIKICDTLVKRIFLLPKFFFYSICVSKFEKNGSFFVHKIDIFFIIQTQNYRF